MGILDWILGEETERPKRIFISFAVEDSTYRDHLVRQGRNKKSPFDFMDMSVKRPWEQSEWKKKCRSKIKKSDGVIVLLSKNTWHAGGARWEIKCAREEKKPIIGMHIKKNDKGAIPPELKGKRVVIWSWANLERFVNQIKI
ncbi:TIR domain-containing protein [Gelidibacter japonicus]|uniref:TIR domain-containing protein n=1 Tax=Gelidibacter japonicus TaxID=1962232 RepID=UPI003A8D53AF